MATGSAASSPTTGRSFSARASGHPLDVNFGRVCLVGSTGPGETQTIDFALAPPPPGEYLLEFDLVSEGVCWFERNGSATATVAITVGGANAG